MRFPTVENDEVGKIPFFVLEAAREDFLERGGVVVLLFSEFEFAVFGAVGSTVGENNHTSDDVLTALVRNVVALNATRRVFEAEESLKFSQGLVGGDVEKLLVGEDDFFL